MRSFQRYILKGVLGLVLCGMGWEAVAQSDRPLSQYGRLPYFYNPAAAGMEDFTDLKVGFKQQWSAMNQVPRSYILAASHAFNGVNLPSLASYGKNRSVKPTARHAPKVGISGFVLQEAAGAYSDLQTGFSTAAHVPVSRKFYLSAGLTLGYNQVNVKLEDLRVRDRQDSYYQGLLGANGSLRYFSLDAGLMLYSDQTYIGYSAQRLLRVRLNEELDGSGKTYIRHTALLGHTFQLDPDWELAPGALVRYEGNLDLIVNLNAKVRYRNMVWVGAGVVPEGSVSALVGFAPTNRFTLNYSYDYSIAGANEFDFGDSHELVVGMALFKKSNQRAIMW
ncbi:PorP/SprF family type IX secretion system membrane protein [Rufibacter quisquiliarum]|uniref:Type IX secretion system PorP/SprF family membrane protein n=1 Tax=Rufibacter quisquiliarum TaxID=1549639 RepID=A0A839GXC1_9BACT|nr:PorP/SprF family type IX secretion system membrane protein [Rufibacter quisquiliarum]MBA9079386.1 type IX secretion system PorP/SprF family membrane protein [Rufibacter quisquiliarum]